MRMRIVTREFASQEMAVAVCVVLLAALLGLYWSSTRVEGNDIELTSAYKCLLHL